MNPLYEPQLAYVVNLYAANVSTCMQKVYVLIILMF
jgi:hypothetical protein